jgi:hypothetical protein
VSPSNSEEYQRLFGEGKNIQTLFIATKYKYKYININQTEKGSNIRP